MSDEERGQPVLALAREPETDPGEQDPYLLGWALPALTGLGVFLIYLRTLAPSVVGGDTGELVTIAYKLGVAHPPGYPLFTMLAKLCTFIPFGTIAWRVNLLSALCDSAAAVIILLAVRRWTRNEWAGLLAAGLFAFSPLVWRYAAIAEVFALNNLIVALMLYSAIRYAEGHERKYAYLTAFFFGLGMSNHHTSLFFGLPIMFWILIAGRRELWTFRELLISAGCFFVGLLPYVYLPLADTRMMAVSWGNTSTLNGFFTHVLRREYGTLQLGAHRLEAPGNFFRGLDAYFSAAPENVFYVGIVLALVGLSHHLYRKVNTSLTTATVVSFCLYLIAFNALSNLPFSEPLYLQVQTRFWQQPNILICVWAGVGFGSLAAWVPRWKWHRVPIAGIVFALVLAEVAVDFRAADQHLNTSAQDFARELLRPLPPNSIFWSREDLVTFTARYLQLCEGYRSDVRVIDRETLRIPWAKRLMNFNYPEVTIPGTVYGRSRVGGYDAKQLFDANVEHFKMFANRWEAGANIDWSWDEDYSMWPFGMTSWIVSKHVSIDPYVYLRESESALPQLDVAMLARYPNGSWENEMLKYYWEARLNRADYLIDYGIAHENDRYLLEAGAAGLADSVERAHLREPWVFKRLGLAYSKLAIYDPVYRVKMKDAWSRYLELGPSPDDPDLTEIRNAVSN
ncbi:MAG: hypothetical protein DMF74_14770 [Acidobacteria bacterium]|nr:MAG: hypothetical protein DMF74_14770 [Acidobacteriota bacterium]